MGIDQYSMTEAIQADKYRNQGATEMCLVSMLFSVNIYFHQLTTTRAAQLIFMAMFLSFSFFSQHTKLRLVDCLFPTRL